MKLAGMFAAVLAIPGSVFAQQLDMVDATKQVVKYVEAINGSAVDFANATSSIQAGESFYYGSGPLYNTSMSLIALTTYAMATTLYVSWYPWNDTSDDDGDVVISALAPILVTVNQGIGSIANDKALLIPVNNNPLPGLLDDFKDVLSRLVTELETMYPTISPWLVLNWSQLSSNVDYAKTRMSQSTATQTLQKRTKLCSPDNPTCNGIAVPKPKHGSNKHSSRDAQPIRYPEHIKNSGNFVSHKRAKLYSTDNPICDGIAIPGTHRNACIGRAAEPQGLEYHELTKKDAKLETERGKYYSVEQCAAIGRRCMLMTVDSCLCL